MPTIEQLTALLDKDPDDTFLLYALAQEHAKAHNHDDAVRCYDRVIAIAPNYFYAYYHTAPAQQADGDDPAAAQTARQGLDRAQAANDAKASSELAALLDELT
ncbi:MAG: hypothetical protein JJU33_12015 [Phycisphaerales bacterium]|nr:hypothetical protein [Phycisphaerales bacterium]